MSEQELLEELALLEAMDATPDYIGGIRIVTCSNSVGISMINSERVDYGSPTDPATGETISDDWEALRVQHDILITLVDVWNDREFDSPEEEKEAREARQARSHRPPPPLPDQEPEVIQPFIEAEPEPEKLLPGMTTKPRRTGKAKRWSSVDAGKLASRRRPQRLRLRQDY